MTWFIMPKYIVLRYYYRSKITQAITPYISIHKLTCTTSRFNSSVMANVVKVGLENITLKIKFRRDAHWPLYNIRYCVNIKCTVNSTIYVCTSQNPAIFL